MTLVRHVPVYNRLRGGAEVAGVAIGLGRPVIQSVRVLVHSMLGTKTTVASFTLELIVRVIPIYVVVAGTPRTPKGRLAGDESCKWVRDARTSRQEK